MHRHFLPIAVLLLGSAFLLFAGGINGLILPVRGQAEGFSAVALGLLGTGWAIGYVSGCIFTARLVARVGHIRAFGAMAAIAAISILASALLVSPTAWIILRALCGFCFAGAAMIVESWLTEQTNPTSRGKVFGVYTMVNLGATTAGQLMLTTGDPNGFTFFAIAAIFYCLALVPTAISSTSTPAPLVHVSLDLKALWRNSPVAVIGVGFVGVSNSAFGTLAAVYADRVGLVLATIALFTSIPILVGALAQIPVGWLSDKMDRRKVLVGLTVLALAADTAFLVLAPESRVLNLVLAGILGGSIFAMYPVIVAHANDHAAPGTAIQISGGLLLLYGVGGIIGPLLAGWAMAGLADRALFIVTAGSHVIIIFYTIWRILQSEAVAVEDKKEFQMAVGGRASTPQTAVFADADNKIDATP